MLGNYTLVWHHTSITVVPAVWVHISKHSDHVIAQRQRLEGGGDDDVASLWEHGSQKHCPSVDVGGRLDNLLGHDVMHPILPVQFHLGKGKTLGLHLELLKNKSLALLIRNDLRAFTCVLVISSDMKTSYPSFQDSGATKFLTQVCKYSHCAEHGGWDGENQDMVALKWPKFTYWNQKRVNRYTDNQVSDVSFNFKSQIWLKPEWNLTLRYKFTCKRTFCDQTRVSLMDCVCLATITHDITLSWLL